jgi:hypothetical protein
MMVEAPPSPTGRVQQSMEATHMDHARAPREANQAAGHEAGERLWSAAFVKGYADLDPSVAATAAAVSTVSRYRR